MIGHAIGLHPIAWVIPVTPPPVYADVSLSCAAATDCGIAAATHTAVLLVGDRRTDCRVVLIRNTDLTAEAVVARAVLTIVASLHTELSLACAVEYLTQLAAALDTDAVLDAEPITGCTLTAMPNTTLETEAIVATTSGITL